MNMHHTAAWWRGQPLPLQPTSAAAAAVTRNMNMQHNIVFGLPSHSSHRPQVPTMQSDGLATAD